MAQFKNIPTARIADQRSVEGRNEDGALVRITLIETADVTYISRFVDGVGVSTVQFSGARRGLAEAEVAVMVAQEQLTDVDDEEMDTIQYAQAKAGLAPAAEPEPEASEAAPEPGSPAWQATATAWLATVEAYGAEPEAPVAEPARQRGPNRPDAETEVWAEGDLAVVMVIGRGYRYDLRRGVDLIESLPASRNWRSERQGLIAKGQNLLMQAA